MLHLQYVAAMMVENWKKTQNGSPKF